MFPVLRWKRYISGWQSLNWSTGLLLQLPLVQGHRLAFGDLITDKGRNYTDLIIENVKTVRCQDLQRTDERAPRSSLPASTRRLAYSAACYFGVCSILCYHTAGLQEGFCTLVGLGGTSTVVARLGLRDSAGVCWRWMCAQCLASGTGAQQVIMLHSAVDHGITRRHRCSCSA